MNPLWLLPLGIPLCIVVVWIGGMASTRIERVLDRVGRVGFGRFVSYSTSRERRIEAAYIDTTYRTYAAKSYLFAVLGFVAGAIGGAYVLTGLLAVLEPIVHALAGLPRTMTRPLGIHPQFTLDIATGTWWLIVLGGGLVIGLAMGGFSYLMRWQLPVSDAEVRRRGIDEGLPRTTAFMYALSRGGMEFPQILRTLGEHRGVYGETAKEMNIAVREMDLFGRDMITALRRMSRRTPSEQFKTFSENLSSILQSGSDLPEFFHQQYERFKEDAEEHQEDVLELLATIAEGYVTILVAGMLFLITILLIFGLTVADTLWLIQLMIYLMIPLANLGFAVLLAQKLDELGMGHRSGHHVLDQLSVASPVRADPPVDSRVADGGHTRDRTAENRRILGRYDRVSRLKRLLRSPFRVFLWNPTKLLWITVPIALVFFAVRAPAAFLGEGVAIRALDDLVVQSVLFVLGTYAIVRYLHRRRIDRIEAAIPELLQRLASLNEAGMSIVNGFERVRHTDLGVLTPEVQRIWLDIEYGSNVDDSLIRFGRRVRTTAITRVVVLLTNAMRASGDLGPVLRIASEQARSEVKLRQQRRQQMMTYLIVIYISFLVFIVIIIAVNEVLVPSLPDTVPVPEQDEMGRLGVGADTFTQFGDVDKAAYTLVFFHAALIQAVCAGFIAGQLGEGTLRDGAKHAAIMLGLAYLVFLLFSSPVASLTVMEATSTGESIHIEGASLSDGGFVAVYDEDGLEGELLGHTAYLPSGSHDDVVIPLQQGEITEDRTVRIVPHLDTNGNEQFDFEPPYDPELRQVDRPYDTVSDAGQPGIEVEVTYLGD